MRRRSVSWALVFSPIVLLLVFVTLAAHVRIGLGHWPKPMWEDYSTPAYTAHLLVFVGVALFTVYAAIPLWLLAICLPWFRISLKTHLAQAGTYAAGWGLIALYAKLDFGWFVTWFLD